MSLLYLFFMLVSYCYKPYVIVVFIFYVSLILLQTVCLCYIYNSPLWKLITIINSSY